MDEKVTTINVDPGNNSLLASILPQLSNRGIDTAALMGMLNNNRGGLLGNGGGLQDIIALIVIAAIFGGGFGNGNGIFGGGGNANTSERELLQSLIQRNGIDVNQLANTLNCSIGKVDAAIGQVATQICNIANQQGTGFMQVVNSLQAGNAALANQLAQCCCDMRSNIKDCCCDLQRDIASTNANLTRGFADIGYALRDQTCSLEKAIAENTAQVLAGQRAAEMREMQREIATLQEQNQTYKLGNMMMQNNAPVIAALNHLQSEVDGIKCKLPRTEVINAAPDYVPINRSINVGYAPASYCAYGNWNGAGFSQFGGGGCCGNPFTWG